MLVHVQYHPTHICTCRFINEDDIRWFDKTLKRVIQEELEDEYLPMVEHTHWFVDFLRYSNFKSVVSI